MEIFRHKDDISTKEYEVLYKYYIFDLTTRKKSTAVWNWQHRKYYKTMESALQAVRDLRNNSYTSRWEGNGKVYITRYKAVRRWDMP